ncbi:MAG: hypothetical protein JNL79_36275 [Myxococcales bacterium]|nr:hypothetical protein [Myxococcales bacterium]
MSTVISGTPKDVCKALTEAKADVRTVKCVVFGDDAAAVALAARADHHVGPSPRTVLRLVDPAAFAACPAFAALAPALAAGALGVTVSIDWRAATTIDAMAAGDDFALESAFIDAEAL